MSGNSVLKGLADAYGRWSRTRVEAQRSLAPSGLLITRGLKIMENPLPLKMVSVSYESPERGKILVFWIGGCLCEVVIHGG